MNIQVRIFLTDKQAHLNTMKKTDIIYYYTKLTIQSSFLSFYRKTFQTLPAEDGQEGGNDPSSDSDLNLN